MKVSFYFSAILLSLLLVATDGLGQRWIKHGLEQGLTSTLRINAILEDNDDDIWLATDQGVKRAGKEEKSSGVHMLWTAFSRANGNSLVSDQVNAISVDREGNVWFGTVGGISRIDPRADLRNPQSWRNYTKANTMGGLKDNNIVAIAVDLQGNKWFATRFQGISIASARKDPPDPDIDPYLDPKNWLSIDDLTGLFVNAIAVDGVGAIWVGTTSGVVRFDSVGAKGRLFDKEIDARTIFTDSRGYVWFGTFGDGVWRVHQDSLEAWQHYNPIGGKYRFSYIRAIAEDKDGFLWFGHAVSNTPPSVSVIDPRTNLYDRSNWVDFDVATAYNVSSMFRDSDGNMWIGTVANGLTQYDDTWTTFVASRDPNIGGLSDNTIRALTIDNQHNLWVGTENGHICKLHLRDNPMVPRNWKCFNVPGEPENTVRSLFLDNKGYLWVGAQNGIYRVRPNADLDSPNNWLGFDGQNCGINVRDRIVRAIVEDKRGYIWIGTNDGLWRTHNDSINIRQNFWCENFNTFNTSNGLADNLVFSLLAARDGYLWIGTTGGVNRVDPDSNLREKKNWQHFNSERGLLDNRVQAMLQDTKDNIWFGTAGGINKLNATTDLTNATQKIFSSIPGLPPYQVISLSQPNKKEIWFGTSGGAGKLDLLFENRWTFYTDRDGLGSNWVLSIAADTSKKDVWLGTLSGGVSRYRAKMQSPKTFLIDTYDIVPQAQVRFGFKGLDVTTPTHELLYSYKFDNDDWSPFSSATSAERTISGSDRPTRHVFKVQAMDRDGNIDPTPAMDVFWRINQNLGGWTSQELDSSTVRLYIPPAVLSERGVAITPVNLYELDDSLAILAFEVSLLSQGSTVKFKKPMTMQVILKNLREAEKRELAIFRKDALANWIGIGGSVESGSDGAISITTAITELGRYAVRKKRSTNIEPPGNEVNIQPRIFSPALGGQGYGDRASISFLLKNESTVTIKVYNLSGRLVRALCENRSMNSGRNVIEWNGRDYNNTICSSGLYIVTIESAGNMATKQVVVMNE
jgi:ligand-binding sensor domain-containing protein